ncbi:MAG: glycoside hydrolase family 3 C-terminal domain-containing protein [Ruminiclostridium sp.]|nr:glycoside hydrolase family 3 C-terminal domain-containing protein [Ruminiclostridium sp.]
MLPFQNPALSDKERVSDLLSRLTIDEKIGLLATHQLPVERLGIGEWYVGHEVARGLVNREEDKPSTVFPQPMGMAASFDTEMMLEIGKTAAREARAYYNERKSGGLMVWGPTVDLARDPRWGRNEECYGEDPCLTGEMSIAYTKGLRGEEKTAATIPTLKHFCANNHEEGRGHDNANLNPRLRHEYYYAAFRASIERGGTESIMAAYNELCHTPAVMNHDLKNVLKNQWGLTFVVTDGGDFSQNVTHHKTFASHAEALKACINAGTDCMTDNIGNVHTAARNALARGLITEADIDTAIGNTLTGRFHLGEFDPSTPFDSLSRKDVNTEADRNLNRRAANEGMVLLENCGGLPIEKEKAGRIALLGPNIDCNLLDWYTGTSSYNVSIKADLLEEGCDLICDTGWDIVKIKAPNGKFLRLDENGNFYADADNDDAEQFYYCHHDHEHRWVNLQSIKDGRIMQMPNGEPPSYGKTTVYGWFTSETLEIHTHSKTGKQIISDYLHKKQFTLDGENRLVLREKSQPDENVMFEIITVSRGSERIAEIAEKADTVIYCGGNDPEQVARECYDRRTIELPPVQREAVMKLAEIRSDFVFVIVSSYTYAMPFTGKRPAAILWTSHAGPELGHAFADTIFGRNNPAGRTPVTWYECDEDLGNIKDYDIMKNKMTYLWFEGKALYPFGHGLSYSAFSYDNLSAKVNDNEITLSLNVRNDGKHDGDEVVQVYFRPLSERIRRPIKKLCAFKRVNIPAGEEISCEISVPFRELEFYDVSRERFCLESGEYELMVGSSSEDIRLTAVVNIKGEEIPPRDFSTETPAQLYDKENNTEIYIDPSSAVSHVRGLKWTNTLTYQNVDFNGAKSITLSAAAPVDPKKIAVILDKSKETLTEIEIASSDGFTDFHDYTAEITADGLHDLTLSFGENLCIKSIKINK